MHTDTSGAVTVMSDSAISRRSTLQQTLVRGGIPAGAVVPRTNRVLDPHAGSLSRILVVHGVVQPIQAFAKLVAASCKPACLAVLHYVAMGRQIGRKHRQARGHR